jgi:hypothetical protein
MQIKERLSWVTRRNWWIDTVLLLGGILAILSGIYFLFLPTGGYQGGRNPYYAIQIIFARSTWEDLHTWGGIVMILAAVIHIIIHWDWISRMLRGIISDLIKPAHKISIRGRFNRVINLVIGLAFLATAISGVYLLFVTGGKHGLPDPMYLFSRTTWDLIHTWAAILMILAAVLHFAIHWKWVTKVTKKIFRSPFPVQASNA